jgi:methionyl aminopeptidase
MTREAEMFRIGPILSGILAELGRSLRPGLRTRDLDVQARALLQGAGLRPQMLNYKGFPAAIAVSIDDEVLHGIPSDRTLEDGQLVKIQLGGSTDEGTVMQGWTFALGSLSDETERLRATCREALLSGLSAFGPGRIRGGDLGTAIQGVIEAAGLSVVRDYVGYGIGERPIQAPQLKCYGKPGQGERLLPGMMLHVHAIAAAGRFELRVKDDKWTAVTQDGRPAALFTAVVHVREAGCDIVTPLLA